MGSKADDGASHETVKHRAERTELLVLGIRTRPATSGTPERFWKKVAASFVEAGYEFYRGEDFLKIRPRLAGEFYDLRYCNLKSGLVLANRDNVHTGPGSFG